MKEEKIASFQQKKVRLQLIEITTREPITEKELPNFYKKYQIRLNRKVIDTSISEYTERKLFAQMVQNIVLQLKIY